MGGGSGDVVMVGRLASSSAALMRSNSEGSLPVALRGPAGRARGVDFRRLGADRRLGDVIDDNRTGELRDNERCCCCSCLCCCC